MLKYDDLFTKKFKQGADGPEEYDCYSFARLLLARVGITIPVQMEVWQKVIATTRARNECITEGKKVFTRLEKPTPYCIIVFSIMPPYVTHMGVVLENLHEFIHMNNKTGVAVESFTKDPWKRSIDGFYEYRV